MYLVHVYVGIVGLLCAVLPSATGQVEVSAQPKVEARRACLPVDCKWGIWSEWSACNTTCGASGVQTRNRTVITAVSCGGLYCEGPTEETQPCNRFCLNGGAVYNGQCSCTAGYTGSCCESRAPLTDPPAPPNAAPTGPIIATISSIVGVTCVAVIAILAIKLTKRVSRVDVEEAKEEAKVEAKEEAKVEAKEAKKEAPEDARHNRRIEMYLSTPACDALPGMPTVV
ncbi:uncharacterized protein LOC144917697 [Branchiostoma floridae x Branchiostoma belcheri]